MENTNPELLHALECLLFSCDRPLPEKDLAEMLEIEPAQVFELAMLLRERYRESGLQVVQVAGGFQLCTRTEYGKWVEKLHEPFRLRLSQAALETLAIVAYKQPITRPEIEAIRGVNADGVIGTLLERDLVRECGRRETPGRPMTYATTDLFLTRFGLNRVTDLPEIELPSPEQIAAMAAQNAEAEPAAIATAAIPEEDAAPAANDNPAPAMAQESA